MKVSIIMPVYNAAQTIQDSLESIQSQSYRDFEVVFIDDCCTDDTPAILTSFQESSGIPCRIVRQEKNGGVAAARNRGLEEAQGDFLAFVDADDRIEPMALERAVTAIQKDTDIVGWDWTLGFEKNGRYMRQADYKTPLDALRNLTGGTMRWNLWLFLIRRDLVVKHGLRFIDGANMGEDMMFMLKAFSHARGVMQIHEPLYRYNAVNSTSISRQFSEIRRKEIETNIREAEKTLQDSVYARELGHAMEYLKLYLKLPLLISADRSNYDTWYSWFPESNAFAMQNKALPFRTQLLQGMAAKRLWWGVKMYYLCVYKFIYGIIYR